MFVGLGLVWSIITTFLGGGGIGGIAKTVTDYLGKLSDNDTAKVTAAVGADAEVAKEQIRASATAFHDRVDLIKSVKLMQWLIAAALVPPIMHSGAVYLDSTPFLYLGWDSILPHFAFHEQGSWAVVKAPPPYDEREWQMIASLLGIQSVATIGLGALKLIRGK